MLNLLNGETLVYVLQEECCIYFAIFVVGRPVRYFSGDIQETVEKTFGLEMVSQTHMKWQGWLNVGMS